MREDVGMAGGEGLSGGVGGSQRPFAEHSPRGTGLLRAELSGSRGPTETGVTGLVFGRLPAWLREPER
eukprot:scaffold191747_cov27-Tisochrysis_lutea.AAC.1